jgi:hypothetical protein
VDGVDVIFAYKETGNDIPKRGGRDITRSEGLDYGDGVEFRARHASQICDNEVITSGSAYPLIYVLKNDHYISNCRGKRKYTLVYANWRVEKKKDVCRG